MVLDDLDRRLLELLLEDARRSFRQLAQLANSTAPTVAARVRRMEELGIILGYHVKLDPRRFGDPDSTPFDIDVHAPATAACHQCHKQTSDPVWQRIGDIRHPFCCTTCRDAFATRYERFSQPPTA